MLRFVCSECGATLPDYSIACPQCSKPFVEYGEDGTISLKMKIVGDKESFQAFTRAIERRLDPDYSSMFCIPESPDYQEYMLRHIRESLQAYPRPYPRHGMEILPHPIEGA